MSDVFTCALCGGTFEKSRSDAEAQAEYRRDFPDALADEAPAAICEDCYAKVMTQHREDARRMSHDPFEACSMPVSELVERLKAMPANARVLLRDADTDWAMKPQIRLAEDGYVEICGDYHVEGVGPHSSRYGIRHVDD